MRIVEDSYYDHEEYGRVVVLSTGTEVTRFLPAEAEEYAEYIEAHHEGNEKFKELTEPAPQTISAPVTDVGAVTPNPS